VTADVSSFEIEKKKHALPLASPCAMCPAAAGGGRVALRD